MQSTTQADIDFLKRSKTLAMISFAAISILAYALVLLCTLPLMALAVTIAVLAAALFVPTVLLAFLVRKTIKGAFNCTIRPIKDLYHGKNINGTALICGVLNVVSLGLFSLSKKIYKGFTGYTKRFGLPATINFISDPTQPSCQQHTLKIFKSTISKATNEQFPNGDSTKRFFLRTCLGLRHPRENITKEFHNAYLEYLANKPTHDQDFNYASMPSFFASPQCSTIKGKLELSYNEHFVQEVINELNSTSNFTLAVNS